MTRAEQIERAARALCSRIDAIQDAIDNAPDYPGRRLLPRDQRESVEHKDLRAALALPPDPPGEEFRRGAEAMREAAARYVEGSEANGLFKTPGTRESVARDIRALPLPGAKEGT